jgi:hypothetical protein
MPLLCKILNVKNIAISLLIPLCLSGNNIGQWPYFYFVIIYYMLENDIIHGGLKRKILPMEATG